MVRFVDWDLATATAKALGKSGPKVSFVEAGEAVADLRGLTEEARGHVAAFTGLLAAPSGSGGQTVRVVDRADWASLNIAGLREVITPLVSRFPGGREPAEIVQAVGSRVTAVQTGVVLAYLSGRVLGQFEVFSSDPGQLLLVAPNIVEAERRLGVDPRDFRLWVCLHEVTHQVQFTAVDWMRGHFLAEIGAFVEAADLDAERLAERLGRAISTIAEAVLRPQSRASVLDLVQTPAQRQVLDRLTALMTVLEGHAEYVMDGVGPSVVSSVDVIRSRFDQRRHGANPVERVVRRLLGIEVKLRQYAEGRRFVDAVVESVGMAGFNQIWQSPATLPTLDEIADPAAWVARVVGDGVRD